MIEIRFLVFVYINPTKYNLIYTLPSHHMNFSKRIIKSPKIYFFDTGLLCFLLRIRNPQDILTHNMRGSIFESFIISEIYKTFTHAGEIPPLYFWRDKTGHEVDLIIEASEKLIPIEIKSGETISSSFLNNLKYYMSLKGNNTSAGSLVYGGNKHYQRERITIKTWFQCS